MMHSRTHNTNVRYLSSFVDDRDNNFNLLRLFAAFLVLYSHCYAVTTGLSSEEPLRAQFGVTFGSIAVDIFFVTSGFLVTSSLLIRRSAAHFLRARVLRIFPALIVAQLLTVFILGTWLTSLPLNVYISSTDTIISLVRNISLFTGISFTLPGVFENNPMRSLVNASLWTLPYEIGMYAGLFLLWFMLSRSNKNQSGQFERAIFSVAALSLAVHICSHFMWRDSALLRLTCMFSIGSSFYLLKERMAIAGKYFAYCAIFLMLSTINKQVFFIVYTFVIPYLVFCLAYLPKGFIRSYNSIGDYSYGIYIYAFPIQQSLVFLLPGISITKLLILSTMITSLLAMFSWHFIESRALKYK